MAQARGIDTHEWYRTGGIDWVLAKEQNDFLVLKAGLGKKPNAILREQVDGCVRMGIPYLTYWIFSPLLNLKEQVLLYLAQPGVKDAWTSVDVEPPWAGHIRGINSPETQVVVAELEQNTGRAPLMYSCPKYILECLGNPSWLQDYWWWIAQYTYEIWLIKLFQTYESYLKKYAATYPSWVRGKPLQEKTVLHQFTPKGIARQYIASYYTKDPVYETGITEADLNLSMKSKEEWIALMTNSGSIIVPGPDPEGDWYGVPFNRNIRLTPNAVSGTILTYLREGDRVLISHIVDGVPGKWGKTILYDRGGVETMIDGYIYMNSLVKI